MELNRNYNYYTPYVPTYVGSQQIPTYSLRPTPLQWYWFQGGEEVAKNWSVMPGNTVALWDADTQVIYLKSTDQTGRPTIQTLDYTIRENMVSAPSEYITKSELDSAISSLQEKLDSILKKKEDKSK